MSAQVWRRYCFDDAIAAATEKKAYKNSSQMNDLRRTNELVTQIDCICLTINY